MKKTILTLLAIFSLLVITGCGCNNKNEEDKKVTEEDLTGKTFEEQTIDELAINNFTISATDNDTYISMDLVNKGAAITLEYIKIYLYNQEDTLLFETYGYIGGTIEKDETRTIVTDIDVSLDVNQIDHIKYEKL